jgi:hypothetical protein
MARGAVKKMQRFGADEKILVIIAHDASLLAFLRTGPEQANEWHAARWEELGR